MEAFMHELTDSSAEFGLDALESSDEFDTEWSDETDGEAVFDEVEEMELAAALLEVHDEAELDEFLGKLIKRAGRAVRKAVKSPIGKALGGVLKRVARTALPIAGAALGNLVVPGAGGVLGGKLASAAGRMFGLELEGMSPQDQELEIARRFVRLSGDATRRATQMPAAGSPSMVAKNAVLAAAADHAPGLVARHGGSTGTLVHRFSRSSADGPGKRHTSYKRRAPGATQQGTWSRRGRTIVLTLV
jgi:hypothetical protein